MSSDDQLNRMWYAGAYTTQMDMVPAGVASCFTQPVIFDGAKRDRAIWSGDLMITNPVAQLSLGHEQRARTSRAPSTRIMNLQAANGRLTSAVGFRGCGAFDYAVTYSAYSAILAIQYYRYTGDTAYITSLLPRLEERDGVPRDEGQRQRPGRHQRQRLLADDARPARSPSTASPTTNCCRT